MSIYLEKSKQNLNAGDLLIKSGLPNPSVHCSYYATLQYMLHIIHKVIGNSKTEFDAGARNNNEGTHDWAKKLVGFELAKKSQEEFKWFQRRFPELKQIRKNADYTEAIITKDDGIDALKRSDALINTLRNNFK